MEILNKFTLNARKKETLAAYLFLLPSLVFFIGFVIIPIGMGIVTSFFDYTSRKFEFNGFENYITLFQDDIFIKSLWNTVRLVVIAVPIIVVFSLLVSLLLYSRKALTRSIFRTIFYLPVVTGSVAVTVVWKWIFDQHNGVLNYLLMELNIIDTQITWLADNRFSLYAIAFVLITTSVGQPIILYIAALGNLDQSQVEAAQVDGANGLQVFRYVKWPGILPTTLYVVMITTINTFQAFALVQLLTNGGPFHGTSTIMFLVYETAFKQFKFGYANAMGVILAIVIGTISMIQNKLLANESV